MNVRVDHESTNVEAAAFLARGYAEDDDPRDPPDPSDYAEGYDRPHRDPPGQPCEWCRALALVRADDAAWEAWRLMADVRAKALGYLRDGKVHVLHSRTPANERRPVEVVAVVEGHHRALRITYSLLDSWSCNCQEMPCAHMAAVQLVTGHPSAAARQPL